MGVVVVGINRDRCLQMLAGLREFPTFVFQNSIQV